MKAENTKKNIIIVLIYKMTPGCSSDSLTELFLSVSDRLNTQCEAFLTETLFKSEFLL